MGRGNRNLQVDCVVLRDFMTEYKHDLATTISHNKQIEDHLKDRPKAFRVVGVAIITFLFFSYFVWQVWIVLSPPGLTVFSPGEYSIVYDRAMTISGSVTPGSILSINSEEVLVGEDGSFSQEISLHSGVNEFVFVAKKRYGREAKVSRTVYFQANEVVNKDYYRRIDNDNGFSVTN